MSAALPETSFLTASSPVGLLRVFVKVAVIGLFIVVGAFYVRPENWTPFAPNGGPGIFAGAFLIFFAYIGFDAMALGNHEFDYGMDGRINVTDTWASFPYTSCNFYYETAGVRGANVLDPYVTLNCGAVDVAFVGITTPEERIIQVGAGIGSHIGPNACGIVYVSE